MTWKLKSGYCVCNPRGYISDELGAGYIIVKKGDEEAVMANDSAVDSVDCYANAGSTGMRKGKFAWSKRSTRQLCFRFGAFAMLLVIAVSLLSMLPVYEYLAMMTRWVREHLILGTLGFILAFWVAVPLCLPATAFEMMAGFLFGVPYAVVVITIGKTGGSTLAFLIGRFMGKEMIGGYLRTKFPTFQAFSEVLNSPSWKPILLYQVSSLPNLVKIYSLAITQVSLARFVVSTAAGSVPHAIMWAYIGGQTTDIAAILTGETKMTTSRIVMVITGISFTVLVITFLVVYTKRQLQKLQKRDYGSSSEEEGLLLAVKIDAAAPGSAMNSSQCVRLSTPACHVRT